MYTTPASAPLLEDLDHGAVERLLLRVACRLQVKLQVSEGSGEALNGREILSLRGLLLYHRPARMDHAS